MGRGNRVWAGLASLLLGSATLTALGPAAQAAVLPPGFSDALVAQLSGPTGLAFTPDGRMLATTQSGRLRVVQANGNLVPTPALDLSPRLCSTQERGLLSVAVDPQFSSNQFIYLFWTFKKAGTCETGPTATPVNRVARYVLPASNLVNPASETVLIDNIPSPNGYHNAGDLHFGHDGLLYVSTGDGGNSATARQRHRLQGKILRVTRAGAIPAGNPFQGSGTARCNVTGGASAGTTCREIFASGLRNPFRMAFDPNQAGTRFHINDVGWNSWEEIDLGTAGADYGWDVREGHCAYDSTTNCGPPPAGMTNPIFDYPHTGGCSSITGGAFVPAGLWPAEYQGRYLFADYVCGKIFRLDPDGSGGFTRTEFASGLGPSSAVHLAFGPYQGTQALYYTVYEDGGQVRRIVHHGGNQPPVARVTATPSYGPAPLTVTLDGSASSDPDGSALTYLWDFGDGEGASGPAASVQHTYPAGSYTASLVVRDADGAPSPPATAFVSSGNTPPVPSIDAPAAGARFAFGEQVTLTGSATDAESGDLPGSALSWNVLLHHNDHVHPVFSGTGNNLAFTGPQPEDLAAAKTSYVEVQLTATDPGGLSASVSRDVPPKKVTLTFATTPEGRKVKVRGSTFTAPVAVTSWQGWRLTIEAPSPQGQWKWKSWSDGGARVHTITTPAAARTYTARFALV